MRGMVLQGGSARAGCAVVALWLALAAPPSAAGERPDPVEHYTRPPLFDRVSVSPSGRRLAAIVVAPSGRKHAAVMDLDPVGPLRSVAGYGDADVESVQWINDDRLVYEAYQSKVAEVRENMAGTFAVDHDGSDTRQLIAWRGANDSTGTTIRSRVLPYGWYLHSAIDDGGNDVFVYRIARDAIGDAREVQLARMDTVSGLLTSLSFGMPDGSWRWLLDAKREPRVITAYRKGRTLVHWREGDGPWQQVADFDSFAEAGPRPWAVDESGQVLVTMRDATGVEALFRFDPRSRKTDPQPLVRVAGFDLSAQPVFDSGSRRLLGARLRADRRRNVWFDAELERIQRGVDAALPADRGNLLLCGRCSTAPHLVVASTSDRQPTEYFLFNRRAGTLSPVAPSRPWIEAAKQGRRSLHRIAARDGLQIPLYITHPPGAQPQQALPAVVLVHGGPWVRGSDLDWDATAQFLASRGYRVLEPEFRGSQGYGHGLFVAGWREWGRAMQDDLLDAVQWAAAGGLVDRSRVCIVGASYGGYAALMGPIAHPGAYRCAASMAGVTDIGLMFGITWSDFSQDALRYTMPRLVGDPVSDAERHAAASPLKRAAEIKVPLLVAYGTVDRRVPKEHSQRFVQAAQAAGVAVEEAMYAGEGHGFFDPANHADYLGRLERLLATALRPSSN